ncbi:MAG: exodeoxyribonuclease VII small subunit [Halioglobus sp.]
MTKRQKTSSFNTVLAELQAIVEQLENNEVPLEDALKAFEKGIALTRSAQKLLAEAEQKVLLLTESGDGPVEEEFEPGDGQ